MSLRYEIAKLFLQYGIALLGPKGELPVEDEWAGKVLALINEERCADIKDRISEICSSDLSVRNKVTEIIRAFDSQRCEWNFDGKYFVAGCNQFSEGVYYDYCPFCGKRIEIKGVKNES